MAGKGVQMPLTLASDLGKTLSCVHVQAKQVPKSMLAAKSFSPIKELSDIRRWLGILSGELAVRMLKDFEQNHRHPRLLQLYYRSGGFKHAKDHSKSWSMPHGVLNLLSSSSSSSHQTSEVLGHLKEPPLEDEQQYPEDSTEPDPTVPVGEEQPTMHTDVASAEDLGEDHSEGLGLVVTEKSKALARVLEETAYNMFKRLEGTFPCTRLALAASSFQDLGAQGTKSIQHFFSNTGGTAETTMSSRKQKSDSRETTSEKHKSKQKGIMKYLHHVTSVQDDDNHPDTAVQSKELPDGYTNDIAQLPKKGHAEHDESSSLVERVHEISQPSPGKRRVAINEDRVGKVLRAGDQERTSTDSAGHTGEVLQPSNLGTSEREGTLDRSKPDSTDLGTVDLNEQMRILADIQGSSAPALVSEKQVRKQSANNPTKRPRQSTYGAGQQSIGKFFQAQGKPS